MMRTFRRLNEVRETEDDIKATQYLAAGFVEITKEKSKKTGKGGNQKETGKKDEEKETRRAGGVNDTAGETENTSEPD